MTWEFVASAIAIVGIILGYLQWHINRWEKKREGEITDRQKLDSTHSRVEEYSHKSIECERRFVQIEERKADNKSIDDIRMNIIRIAEKLDMALSGAGVGDLIQAHSPIALTPTGRATAIEMGIEARIETNWKKIHELLDSGLESKNPYDIQQFCIGIASTYPERFFNGEDMEFMKTYAYGKGKPLAYYGGMIGVLIRDRYFKYKDIDIAEIDKHDPQKKIE